MKITNDFIKSVVHPMLSIMKKIQNLPEDNDYKFNRFDSDVFCIEIEINNNRNLHLKFKESSSPYYNFDMNFKIDTDIEENIISNHTSKNGFMHRTTMYNNKNSIISKWNQQFTKICEIEYNDFGEEHYFQLSTIHELPPYDYVKTWFDIHNIIDDAIKLPFGVSISYTAPKTFVFTEDMIMKKIWAIIPLMMD
ncbi:TPA: hypothetical protein NV758_001480 [Escherichia coli]|uniref:Uncharacterized protein n=1 Tax=Escherichia phage UB TaxID=2268588 RepID=A0A2Z5HA79_9CAUD|nr:hypothetical protein [Escherichia phage UB]EGE6127986.1 hypothetical protein [Escherichia coli]MED6572926.1 hypothetical protein [Escherichia coli O157]WIL00652.1 hypothetical protein [Escherichia phage vB_EcoM_CRJP21]MDI1143670.1 hypothetical protein [Escherichia coli]